MKKLLFILFILPSFCIADIKWECISQCAGGIFDMKDYRFSLPHGWVYKTHAGYGYAVLFIPDEKHEWKP